MLMNRLLHLAEGKVRVRVESAFPERVMNLMSSHGLRFWDVQWRSALEFSCTVSRKDYRRLRELTENLGCAVTAESRRGAPYFARRFRRRCALVASLALAVMALALGSFCIWDFEIEGETEVSDEEILRTLSQYGVRLGAFGLSIDSEELRNHVLLDLPELSWIAVNVSGFKAHVQVRPRLRTPEIVDAETPVNIVARCDGVVQKIEPLGGEAVVLPGTTVKEGDLLISGASDRGGAEVQLLAAMGRVEARTWYTLTAELPLTVREKCYTGEEKSTLSLCFGSRLIKIFGNSSYCEGEYDKITNRTKWDLFGLLSLPVSTVRESLRFYETEERAVPAAEAKAAGEELLQAYLATLLGEDGSVLAQLCTAEERSGVLRVTLRAECLEQIGRAVALPAA
ncbi:MAG: sporulation protein YqfD [Oscillospiraceae bacterium]